MVAYSLRVVAVSIALIICASLSTLAEPHYPQHPRSPTLRSRDAYTVYTANITNNEGEAHGPVRAPNGSVYTKIDIVGRRSVGAFWTENPQNATATQAFIFMHGKLRNGGDYWTTMNDVLTAAVAANYSGADNNSIIVSPQFFSTFFNSGQYPKDMIAFGDLNAWEASDEATHPNDTTLTAFDALDAFVLEFTNATRYPALKNITVVGHGGGGQLIQRYAMAGESSKASHVHIRYIHGDASSCAYFTEDRPISVASNFSLPPLESCSLYNWWRYGFTNFTGTVTGLLTPKEYFKQYITRDVVSIVGYQDTQPDGDTTCMANIQGGQARRDRNLSWWQYVNMLGRTTENITGFPATFGDIPDWSDVSCNKINLRLTIVSHADHNATEVFSSAEGRSALFSSEILTGFRPPGWLPAAPVTNGSCSVGY